jgi:drug/metabolite transporter (DMT)-like permease
MLAIVSILAGLAITVFAEGNVQLERRGSVTTGVLLALGSAISMGMGTTISHVAIEKAKLLAVEVPAMSQAWQRSLAGVVVAGLAFGAQGLAMRILKPVPVENLPAAKQPIKPRSGCVSAFWLVGTMFMGPVIGISLYQKALGLTQSSAIVLAVAATSALIIIPLARWLEKDKPGIRELVGTVIAIASVAWLCWLRR